MNVLLIEPAYRNKYPPLGLMKLATYHKNRGDNVTFYKGHIPNLILTRLVQSIVIKWIESSPNYPRHSIPCEELRKYIQRGATSSLISIREKVHSPEILQSIIDSRKSYISKSYLNDTSWKWDRVYVTTLFTFYWHISIPTINQAKTLVKKPDGLYVGGVTATLLKDRIIQETGLSDHNFLTGLMDKPGILDHNDPTIIDDLPLDYSILDEVDYKYKEHGNYYGYMTRGCIRRCPFCVVPIIEPEFRNYIPLKNKLEAIREKYGEQKHLLLLDNNVMASGKYYEKIINEIRDSGFYKGAKFIKPDYLTININQIRQGNTDRGRIIRVVKQLIQYLDSLPDSNNKNNLFHIFKNNNIFLNTQYILPDSKNIIEVYDKIKEHYLQTFKPRESLRYVDFNQGVDARLITDEKMKLLSQIAIRPLRIAFDSWAIEPIYTKAVRIAAKYGINYLSNYLLYNHEDRPIELYYRIKHNVELGEELGVKIFSFPMKYHPVRDVEYYSNRTYMGTHWNRKYIRAIQLILNATKGKIGPSVSFFKHAYGHNEEEFHKILLMPDDYIFYRDKNTQNGNIAQWWNDYSTLDEAEQKDVLFIIHTNTFSPDQWVHLSKQGQRVLRHYCKPIAPLFK